MARIFINYRRADDPGFTRALYQCLEKEFSPSDLFMDVEGIIKAGDNFKKVIGEQIASCDVLLAVIGPRWTDELRARTDSTRDHVVLEIGAALDLGKRVIPVRVNGASMPLENVLPESIRALAGLHAVELRMERFDVDCAGLSEKLKEELAAAEQERVAQSVATQFGSDHFDALAEGIELSPREVMMLRAYAAYLRQGWLPHESRYIAEILHDNIGLTTDIVELFRNRFDPSRGIDKQERLRNHADLLAKIGRQIDYFYSLDEERIFQLYVNMISATVRTNCYHRIANDGIPDTMAFKFDGNAIDDVPIPKPFREIWVFSPRIEGVHLRFGPVARGGIRWSDRLSDFRPEALALFYAMYRKSASVVPAGAKGCFLPKWLPPPAERDAWIAEGIAAYRIYIAAILELTDNVVSGKVETPKDIIRYEAEDIYLAVSADKGTATFADIANAIAKDHDYWLGDAFASGGSFGYDHKAIGVTAKGVWINVVRHFREMGIDPQVTPIQVIGVGDISGDVFGNGMLLSKAIKLVAAFDHRHIFLDPDPDPVVSWNERWRIFQLHRSSWADYDRAMISPGGGVFPRTEKLISISLEVQALLDIGESEITPSALLRAILAARADLLWFGGIGTYVRASDERDEHIGDRINNSVRISAAQLRAKVVGEGANFGITQRGRVEAAKRGTRLNNDSIDNIGGINLSDREVNLKIVFHSALSGGQITEERRIELLVEATEALSTACFRTCAELALAISVSEASATDEIVLNEELICWVERDGRIDRSAMDLPSKEEMRERVSRSDPLTRPEIALLHALARVDLKAALSGSALLRDPYFESMLNDYFPEVVRPEFSSAISGHPLREEIVANSLANAIINRGGPAIIMETCRRTGCAAPDVVQAFVFTNDVFDLDTLWARTEALADSVRPELQLELLRGVQRFIRRTIVATLHRGYGGEELSGEVKIYREGVTRLRHFLSDSLTQAQCDELRSAEQSLEREGVEHEVAAMHAALGWLEDGPRLVDVARASGRKLEDLARDHFAAGAILRIWQVRASLAQLNPPTLAQRVSIDAASALLAEVHGSIVENVALSSRDRMSDWEMWLEGAGTAATAAKRAIDGLIDAGPPTMERLTLAALHAALIRELGTRADN